MIFTSFNTQALCNDSSPLATLTSIAIPLLSTNTLSETMSFPMGAHAAFKVRDRLQADGGFGEKWQGGQQSAQNMRMSSNDCKDSPPAKYNEKMMMSIWGLYNRYSVHNMKSHNSL